MKDGRGQRFSNALFGLLAAPSRSIAAAIIDARDSVPRLVAATPDYLALRACTATIELLPPGEAVRRIDAALVGLDASFAAAAAIRAPDQRISGWLVVADRQNRRLGSGLSRRLADAAELASSLLPARRAPAARAPGSRVRSRGATERMIASALRWTPAAGLMIVNLDRFRAVNDALGSSAGDAVLAATEARLRAALGPGGFVARLDGDRFVVLAPGDCPGLDEVARSLLVAVRQPLTMAGQGLSIQASIGVVAEPAADAAPADLLIQADAALRRARAEARDRIAVHEAAHAAAALDGSRLELDLAGALSGGQMHLVYQPFVDLADGRVAGFETLLRWRHPVRGELNPVSFIAAAEATGQILPLGDWVLRTALASAARWPPHLSLAVNVSALQFRQQNFLARVDEALAEAGLAPERLELEITETVLMRDSRETTAVLEALAARGIRIALDDFGTGYSALAYLSRLPHHRIKLDKSFVQDLAHPATRDLIRAIIAVSRTRDVAVTAEGVERPEQLALVRRLGFTHAQGYATGLPVAEPDAWLGGIGKAAGVGERGVRAS